MELSKEHFDEVVKNLATRDFVESKAMEILIHISDAMACIEDGLGPEERLTLIERKLDRLQEILHVEV